MDVQLSAAQPLRQYEAENVDVPGSWQDFRMPDYAIDRQGQWHLVWKKEPVVTLCMRKNSEYKVLHGIHAPPSSVCRRCQEIQKYIKLQK